MFVRLKRAGEVVHRLASSHHNENRREIVMATPSYRERMKAARAEGRAKREAEKAEWHRRIELRCEVRGLPSTQPKRPFAPEGTRCSSTPLRSLRADAMIGPTLKVPTPRRDFFFIPRETEAAAALAPGARREATPSFAVPLEPRTFNAGAHARKQRPKVPGPLSELYSRSSFHPRRFSSVQ
jgi:hypothetical protein